MDKERFAHWFEVSYRTRIKDGNHDGVPEDLRALWERLDWRHPVQSLFAVDAFLRQRNLGGPRERIERTVALGAMGVAATAVDFIDAAAEAALPAGPVGWVVVTALEIGTDALIAWGANRLVQELTGEEEAQFVSPLSRTAATVSAAVPVVRQFTNGANIEAGLRLAYNVPIIGVPIEWAYRGLNGALEWLQEDTEAPNWLPGAAIAFATGFMRHWNDRPRQPAPGSAPAAAATTP